MDSGFLAFFELPFGQYLPVIVPVCLRSMRKAVLVGGPTHRGKFLDTKLQYPVEFLSLVEYELPLSR